MTKNYIDLKTDFYNKTQTDDLLSNKADTNHNHDSTYAKISDLASMTGARLEIIKIEDTVQNLTQTYGTISAGLTQYCSDHNIGLQTNYIYLVQNNDSSDQYIYTNNTFVYQGKSDIDLSNYVQKTDSRLTDAREPLPHTHTDLLTKIAARTTKAQVLSILKEYGFIRTIDALNSVRCTSDKGYDIEHPIKIQNGESAVLTATILQDGNAVPDKKVSFYENDEYLGEANSDINGVATLTYTPNKAGMKTISAGVGGLLDSIDSIIVVTDQPSTISDFEMPSVVQKNQDSEFSVICLDKDGDPIPGVKISFYENYTPTTLTLNVPQSIIQEGEEIQLTATVKDVDGSLIRGQDIQFFYEQVEDNEVENGE